MGKAAKTIGLITTFIIVIVLVGVFSSGLLQNNTVDKNSQTDSNSNPLPSTTPSPQSTIPPQILTYSGCLISFDFVMSQTNGVAYTQLFFDNRVFNSAGYISLENNCLYNVTYCDSNPSQALNATKAYLAIGFMGGDEQLSITNVAFPDAYNIQLILQNTVGTDGTIASAFINGAAALSVSTPVVVAQNSQTVITFTSGINGSFTLMPETSYTIKLVTAKGASVVTSAIMYSP